MDKKLLDKIAEIENGFNRFEIEQALTFAHLSALTDLTLGMFYDLLSKEDADNMRKKYLQRWEQTTNAALDALLKNNQAQQAAVVRARADLFFAVRDLARVWNLQYD